MGHAQSIKTWPSKLPCVREMPHRPRPTCPSTVAHALSQGDVGAALGHSERCAAAASSFVAFAILIVHLTRLADAAFRQRRHRVEGHGPGLLFVRGRGRRGAYDGGSTDHGSSRQRRRGCGRGLARGLGRHGWRGKGRRLGTIGGAIAPLFVVVSLVTLATLITLLLVVISAALVLDIGGLPGTVARRRCGCGCSNPSSRRRRWGRLGRFSGR